MRRHRGLVVSSSTTAGACLVPSNASARWRAHSLRFRVGAQSGSVDGGGGILAGCCDTAVSVTCAVSVVVAISISGGLVRVLSGALNTRRPAIVPPIRLPREPKALDTGLRKAGDAAVTLC